MVETERLIIRRFAPGDLDSLVSLDSDPEVMHFINNGAPVDRDEVAQALEAWIQSYERSAGLGFFAADLKSTGAFVGWFHLRPKGPDDPDPELGYRLIRSVWGQGLAAEGSRALIDWAFERLGVERITAETMAVHRASRRVMEKAGLRYLRSFHADWPVRIPGDEHGDVEYEITRAQWLEDRSADPARR